MLKLNRKILIGEYETRKTTRPIITKINRVIQEIENEGFVVTNKLIAERLKRSFGVKVLKP